MLMTACSKSCSAEAAVTETFFAFSHFLIPARGASAVIVREQKSEPRDKLFKYCSSPLYLCITIRLS